MPEAAKGILPRGPPSLCRQKESALSSQGWRPRTAPSPSRGRSPRYSASLGALAAGPPAWEVRAPDPAAGRVRHPAGDVGMPGANIRGLFPDRGGYRVGAVMFAGAGLG